MLYDINLNMDLELTRRTISNSLEKFLRRNLPNHPSSEIYSYSLFPTGKLFRPLLAASAYCDFQKTTEVSSDVLSACHFLEVHHTYTLVHDDMPCMDNDDYRRGRQAVHKKYGQWQALLTGDGLLNLSYLALSEIEHSNRQLILKLLSRLCGPKGLILGQSLDLSNEMTTSLDKLILTHELKTSRLIQASLLSGLFLSKENQVTIKTAKDLYRLGQSLGIVFQLIDDLLELTDDVVNDHEKNVNPWPRWPREISALMSFHAERTLSLINQYELSATKSVFKEYAVKMNKLYLEGIENIERNFTEFSNGESKDCLLPVMSFLNGLSQI